LEDIIQLLPDHISNQIAAGEVIQRPASAVKELVENSIDAGAKNIKILIKDSGRTLLQVIDDGKGMSTTDARLAFEKHATSKIKTVEDIFKIHSKGFRGEALASIAAVAQVELKTRRPIDDIGTKIVIEGSKVILQEPVSMPVGTQFLMKNIFFNIPARRNFLKKDSEELRQIMIEFDRLALAHTEIAFQVYHNDVEICNLPAASLKQRIVSIFGNAYNQKLVPIEESCDFLKVDGFVSKPDAANSKTKGKQYLFVNKRFIKSNYIQHAIYSAYRDLIQEKEYPFFVLFVEIEPHLIDVNVSPTKQEIKFEDERIVYEFINAGIRRSLMQFNIAPSIDFSIDPELSNFDAMVRPIDRNQIKMENFSSIQKQRPFLASPKMDQTNHSNWEAFFTASTEEIASTFSLDAQPKLFIEAPHKIEVTGKPYQLLSKYILVPTSNSLLVVDQRRAHERVLFDDLLQKSLKASIPSQQLLFPIVIELSMQDVFVISEIQDDLAHLGFDLVQMGTNSFAIQGVPSDLSLGNEKEMILELIEQFKNSFKAKSSKKEKLLISICKILSVKRKQELNEQEMEYLIENLFESENHFKTPSLKNIYFELSYSDMDKHFF
jgi:DNA mismatch repair protein MutL